MNRILAAALTALPGLALAEPFGVWSTAPGCAHLAETGDLLYEPPEGTQVVYLDHEIVFWGNEDNCLIAGTDRVAEPGEGVGILFLNLYCQAPGDHWPETATVLFDEANAQATLRIGNDLSDHSWYELELCRDGTLMEVWHQ